METTRPVKKRLLELSEEIVDLSDSLDELEFESDFKKELEIRNRLHVIGDELAGIQEDFTGDDETFAHFALGSVCSLLKKWDKAEYAYKEALKHWPDHVGILNELFDCLVERRKLEEAREVIEKSIKHGGETPDVLYNFASLVSHMGNTDEAKVILINALARFPNDKGCKALLMELDAINQDG